MLQDALKISVLASGSTGNALYIESEKERLLIDAGLSGKKIKSLMEKIGRAPEDLDGVLITHEHRDHTKGVGVLARKYHLPVYANRATWENMQSIVGKIPLDQCFDFEMGKTKTFGDLDVESFGVSHDAAAAQFYRINHHDHSFVVMTDTGYCSDKTKGIIQGADGYLIESNHDLGMLRMGKYPWSLKQRILGDRGHLSNEDSAIVMSEVMDRHTKKIFLGHLSQENNLKELARMTMTDTLNALDIHVGEDVFIYDTDPNEATPLVEI
ncbi:MBL fold metallo-hydrolase [Enterococcus hirae]|jgi:phosphoribosyl 1,2-cyclic phosphodiesterase|nr:MBL fold metallo-hydrolase [Enterococcaceae bacterium]MCI1919493.1 MBL fold metallo-hydrolase [Enterococcaceae bacterium]MDM8213672.1 MBL fold metallo-hydrolase [Enterococcus hirae]